MVEPVPIATQAKRLADLEARLSLVEDLRHGGGGGTYGDMDHRVTRLELQMEQTGKTLASIDGKLDRVNDRLMQLPTKGDLTTFRWQWVATSVAAIALIVGGIIGGLGWIKPDAAPAAPTVIQMPASQPQR